MDLSLAFEHFGKIIKLSNDEKIAFSNLVHVVDFEKKTKILAAGQICRYEYFVLSGCVRTYYYDEDVNEHTTMFAPAGWWTGNLKSFVGETPSEHFLECLENSTLIRLTKSSLEELYRQIPKFERYFRILLQNRLLATQDRISNHLSSSAEERYQKFLSAYPDLLQRVPLKHVASYLGITPTYLSRLRARR